MPDRAETLFEQLQTASAVLDLVGTPEDTILDCKVWPASEGDAQKMLAKAACGMANSEGGVILIGMKAPSAPKEEPDVITEAAPVANTSLVKSRCLTLISQLVEPGLEGVRVVEVPESDGADSGFVVVFIPKGEGSPCRSLKHRDFFQRVGSVTLPMLYSQLEDRFGRRPHARLEVEVADTGTRISSNGQLLQRVFEVSITNLGRGLARFPAFRFRRLRNLQPPDGFYSPNTSLWTAVSANSDWFSWRGGANHVIYPDETLKITSIFQSG